MFKLSLKPWHQRLLLATLAGVCTFLAFERYVIVPLIFVAPYLFTRLSVSCPSPWSAFRWGILSSYIIMAGVFYWITHVLGWFGQLSPMVSVGLFAGFSFIGELNFPLFTGLLSWCSQKMNWQNRRQPYRFGIWVSLGIPALFTTIEWATPGLFPWQLGHSLYRSIWAIQITEFTGVSFLSFALTSLSVTLGAVIWGLGGIKPLRRTLLVPIALWSLIGIVAWQRLSPTYLESNPTKPLRVALIQANIGSLQKLAARSGVQSKIEFAVKRYFALTDQALSLTRRPELIVWPETAMPFHFDVKNKSLERLHHAVNQWNIPLLTGGYARGPVITRREYNSSALLNPTPNGVESQLYHKHILLTFGEYLPWSDVFPSLNVRFPQIANFMRGTQTTPFVLPDGTRIGVTICYEGIMPRFVRKIANHGIQILVNLTNDSWFGETSEPYLHASLSVFRAVELRVPLVRVANTGTSMLVDRWGRITSSTPIFEEAIVVENINVPSVIKPTVYQTYGDWIQLFFALILIIHLVDYLLPILASHTEVAHT